MGRTGPGIVTAAELDTLALKVRGRESGAMLELWRAVRRFVVMLARRRAASPGCRTTVEDLTQAGFLAVITTADQYEPEAGHSFIQALSFSLRKVFAEESGTRSTKRDVLQYADSIETAAYRDDPEGPTVGELLPDDGAALAFMGVEYALAELSRENSAARSIVEKLLDAVNIKHSEEAIAFRAYYLDGKKKPTARQISRRLYIDVRTVYKYNRRILIAMLPVAFGVYGLFYPDISKRYDDKPNGLSR